MENITEYVELVKAPWGKIFYELLYKQLNIPHSPKINILDFGSGLCVTTNHYSAWHEVTAIEPGADFINNRFKDNEYILLQGDIEKVAAFEDKSFDVVFCHNVLEYIESKEPIISELLRILKPSGFLSVVKHNRVGRVIHTAVYKNDPEKALTLIDLDVNDNNNYLGIQYIYSNDYLSELVGKYNAYIKDILGMRAFYALGQDNSIKYSDEWYQNMLLLEESVSNIDEYKNSAFFNHIIIKKYE